MGWETQKDCMKNTLIFLWVNFELCHNSFQGRSMKVFLKVILYKLFDTWLKPGLNFFCGAIRQV